MYYFCFSFTIVNLSTSVCNRKKNVLPTEWDTDVSRGKLDVIIRQTILKNFGCAISCCQTKLYDCKGGIPICTILRTCNDSRNISGESQSDLHSDKLIKDESEDYSPSDDEYHDAMDND